MTRRATATSPVRHVPHAVVPHAVVPHAVVPHAVVPHAVVPHATAPGQLLVRRRCVDLARVCTCLCRA